jgi:hypothetical protein
LLSLRFKCSEGLSETDLSIALFLLFVKQKRLSRNGKAVLFTYPSYQRIFLRTPLHQTRLWQDNYKHILRIDRSVYPQDLY